VREHHWSPSEIGGLFLDNKDEKGLEFWYEDILQVQEEMKNKK